MLRCLLVLVPSILSSDELQPVLSLATIKQLLTLATHPVQRWHCVVHAVKPIQSV